jgi:phage terminase small subunit
MTKNRQDNGMKALTAKQQKAVDHFIVHRKQVDAYRHAYNVGPNTKDATVHRKASELFQLPHVAEAVAAGIQAASEVAQVDAAYVLRQAAKLHERCMQEIEPFTDRKGNHITDEKGRPLYVFDSSGAARALELVGKHVDVAAFKERSEVSGPGGGPIVVESTLSEDQALALLKKHDVK